MSLQSAIIPLFTHFIPIMFFVFMIVDVLLRNRNRIEHRLVGAVTACYMMLFIEEFVRQQLPIAYSPILSSVWFGISGITITGLSLHLFIKLSRLEHKMPKYIYPYFCYLPTLIVIANAIFGQTIAGSGFHEVGIWKYPVYNAAYYFAMVASNVYNIIYWFVLAKGKAKVEKRAQKEIYNQLMLGVGVSLFFNLIIGVIDFRGYLPPYPYIYGGLAWCLLLRHTMTKYDFLIHKDKRYEKLFNLNPAAIMLMDLNGNVKEANPSAQHLFDTIHLDYADFYSIVEERVKQRIHDRGDIRNCEMTINSGGKRIDVLLDGDYVTVEYEPHLILIIRDVTIQKENERQITFLAYHDSLTRLPNRRYFYEKLNEAIRDAGRNRHKLAVVLFDLDHFKEINDKFGHQVGDRALSHVADLVRETIPNSGLAARLGGDEFVFYLHPIWSVRAVEEKIQQLQHSLERNQLLVDNEAVPIHLSIGVSFYSDNGLDADALLNSADKALYHAKRHGRNQYHLLSKD